LSGLLPDAVPPLRMALAAFANPDQSDGIVRVTVDVSGFVSDTQPSVPLDVVTTVVDQTGRPVASARQTSTIDGPRPAGILVEVPTHVVLTPGDYEVRVSVTNTATATTASVFSQVVVPDFARDALTMSDIAIEIGSNGPMTGTDSQPIAPTTRRTFRSTDAARATVLVYQGTAQTGPLQPVSVRTRIVDVRDRLLRDETSVLEPIHFSGRRTVASSMVLPLPDLSAGEYLLRFDVQMGDRSTSRAIRVTVE
jgi:hypothetical protein